MTDTAQPATAADPVVASDPMADAANAFKTFTHDEPKDEPIRRDEQGRFAREEIEAEENGEQPDAEAESHEAEQDTDEAAEEAQPEPVDLPTSWPAEMAETWTTLPPETQDFIVKREGERDAAVNAKFQEAANLRKAHEGEINEAKTNRQRFAEAADFLMSVVQPQKPPASMLDPQSGDYNPDAYHLASRRYDEQIHLLTQAAQQRQLVAQQEAEEEGRMKGERVAEINSKHMPDLLKIVPDFSDESKADAAFHGLARYALTQGVPEDTELSAFTAVELKLLAKAQKYDEMMAAKAKVTPKAPKPAAPVVKPGVATPRAAVEQQKRKKAFERLDREGSIEAGAAVWKQFL